MMTMFQKVFASRPYAARARVGASDTASTVASVDGRATTLNTAIDAWAASKATGASPGSPGGMAPADAAFVGGSANGRRIHSWLTRLQVGQFGRRNHETS